MQDTREIRDVRDKGRESTLPPIQRLPSPGVARRASSQAEQGLISSHMDSTACLAVNSTNSLPPIREGPRSPVSPVKLAAASAALRAVCPKDLVRYLSYDVHCDDRGQCQGQLWGLSSEREYFQRTLSMPNEAPSSELKPWDRVQQQVAELRRTKSLEDCNAAIEKITQMKTGIAAMDVRCKSRLDSSQAVIDACGEAIAAWFKGLSAPALECAMKEAFQKFDTDGSGFLDIEEFSEAMHTLGIRLKKCEYGIIFHEQDKDGSGTIDLEEFSAMVKGHLAKLREKEIEGERKRYCKRGLAANTILNWVRSAIVRQDWLSSLTTLPGFSHDSDPRTTPLSRLDQRATTSKMSSALVSPMTAYDFVSFSPWATISAAAPRRSAGHDTLVVKEGATISAAASRGVDCSGDSSAGHDTRVVSSTCTHRLQQRTVADAACRLRPRNCPARQLQEMRVRHAAVEEADILRELKHARKGHRKLTLNSLSDIVQEKKRVNVLF